MAAVAAAVLVLPMAWGVWRSRTLELRPVADVAVVQPNREGRVKVTGVQAGRDAPAAADVDAADGRSPTGVSAGAHVTALLSRLQRDDVDLVVLPELFIRRDPRSPGAAPAVEVLRASARRLDAPILFGGLGVDRSEAGDAVPYNSVFLLRPEGLADFRYDKRRLVPVVERTPFLPRRATSGLDATGAYGVGRGWPLAEVGGVGFGPLVCYESSYPEAARALRRQGADVLVNVTNDAWLGGELLAIRTVALWQHPAHLVVRAVENRMGVVRSANTGISLFVDPTGRVHDRTGLFVEDVRVASVVTSDVETLFTRYGDVVGDISALVASGLLLLALTGLGGGPGREDGRAPSLDPSRQHV